MLRRRLAGRLAARRRDEHGVIAVFVAVITCFALIPLAAYAVDIGVQRVARRDAQSIADLVALDLARQLDGRTYSVIAPTLQSLADKSALRNANGTPFKVVPELGTLAAHYDPADPSAYFVPTTTGTMVPTAVRVTASAAVNFTFLSGTGGVGRQAVATMTPSVCFRLGSYAATVSSGNSALLDSMIGDALNLSALSYDGLATSSITAAGLSSQLGVASPDQLANTTVSLNQLYLASANALQAQGGNAAQVALLNSMATASYGALPSVKIGDIMSFGSDGAAALTSSINLLNLVAGSAFLANGTNALAVPNLTVGVPGVSSVTASLKVIEKPQGNCGSGSSADTASTNQVGLDLTFTLVPSSSGLGGLLGLKSGVTTVTVHAAIAPATGSVVSGTCGTPKTAAIKVTSALTSLTAEVTTNLSLLGIPIATLDSTASTSAPVTSTTVQFTLPPDAVGTVKSAGSGTAVPQISVATGDVTLLGAISLGSLVSAITSGLITPLVNPLIANVNSILLGPVATLMGLKVGGADVFLDSLPTCTAVSLVG